MKRRGAKTGFSLIELLCVIGIITILASMLLGAVGRAYLRAKRFAGEMDGPAYVDEMRIKLKRFTLEHPIFSPLTLDVVIRDCNLTPRCASFLRSKQVTYVPFSSRDPEEKVVLVHVIGTGHNSNPIAYTKGWFVNPDPP